MRFPISKTRKDNGMYVMIINIKKEELLKKLISIMIEFEMFDSSVIDGEGIENLAMQTDPVFSSLRALFSETYVYNKTIITPVQSRKDLDTFLSVCSQEGIEFRGTETGSVMVLPCEEIVS